MNNTSQCIFDISHVNKNIRDTLEFVINKEVDVKAYDARKTVLRSILDPKTFLGKFLEDNADKLKDFKKNYEEFLDQVYGDDSTILTKTAEGKIRADHSQNIAIFKGVVYLGETLRDVLFSHINLARQQNNAEEEIIKFVDVDERFDRAIKMFLILQEYQKSFSEFQKVMNETKGQPSPQSNFIVQNELNVLAAMLRFERDHIHVIDNATLDILDRVIQLVQMCEGRRERRDNNSFPNLFTASLKELEAMVNRLGPAYNESYQKNLKDMLDTINAKKENKEYAEEKAQA